MEFISDNQQDHHFSWYKPPIINTSPEIEPISISQAYLLIKGPTLKEKTEHIRKESVKASRDKLKGKILPYVTFSGVFRKRCSAGLVQHSGFICLDFDLLLDLDMAIKRILELLTPVLLFISPSGDGLKIVFAINLREGEHVQYFEALRRCFKSKLNITVDNVKDVARACYLCHDSNAFISESSLPLGREFLNTFPEATLEVRQKNPDNIYAKEATVNKLGSPIEIYRRGKAYIESKESFTEGNRHNFVTNFAGLLNRTGLIESDALNCLMEYVRPGFDNGEILGIVSRVYSKKQFFGVAPLNAFSKPQKNAPIYFSNEEPAEAIAINERSRIKSIRDNYITFPLRLLWGPEETFKARIDEIITGSWVRTTGEIPTSVQRNYLIDARQGKVKPELLLLLAAVRSAIGKRNYTRTTNEFIFERMYGSNPWRNLTRYWIDNLFVEAMARGFITRLPGGRGFRGFYVSIRYKPMELSQTIIDVIAYKTEKKQQVKIAGNNIAEFRKAAHQSEKEKTHTGYPFLKAI